MVLQSQLHEVSGRRALGGLTILPSGSVRGVGGEVWWNLAAVDDHLVILWGERHSQSVLQCGKHHKDAVRSRRRGLLDRDKLVNWSLWMVNRMSGGKPWTSSSTRAAWVASWSTKREDFIPVVAKARSRFVVRFKNATVSINNGAQHALCLSAHAWPGGWVHCHHSRLWLPSVFGWKNWWYLRGPDNQRNGCNNYVSTWHWVSMLHSGAGYCRLVTIIDHSLAALIVCIPAIFGAALLYLSFGKYYWRLF